MTGVTRRSYALAGAALLVVAGGVAALVILVGGGFGNGKPLTRKEYLDRIQAICRTYDRRLQRIPPPANPGNAQALAQSIGGAARAFAQFIETRDRARQVAASIGFTC